MQIIDELEVNRRGPYGGGIGHVSFTGGAGEVAAKPTGGGKRAAREACLLARAAARQPLVSCL